MPSAPDILRARMQSTRYAILQEDHDLIAQDWARDYVDEEILEVQGPPDISANPLADLCRQLSTPGLYGYRPGLQHGNRRNEGLIGAGAHLDRAGTFTKLQTVQYLALGLGDFFVRVDVPPEDNQLTMRLVPPHDIYVEVEPNRPDVPVKLWDLRLRYDDLSERWFYAWDQYDVGGKDRPPSLRVVEATSYDGRTWTATDRSSLFLTDPEGRPAPEGGLVDDAYTYRNAKGDPILPWSWYRSVDSGKMWNHLHKRGVTRGTLNSALLWSYALHGARAASGKYIIVAGLQPMPVDVHQAPKGAVSENRRPLTAKLTPGAVAYHSFQEGVTTALVSEVGPGADIDKLFAAAAAYDLKQVARWGLNGSDASKTSNDPMSGAALYISNKAKREFAHQVEPIFRAADLRTIGVAAALLNQAGLGPFDEDGYSIVYHEIPRSPDEEAGDREDIDWEIERGFLSPVDGYIRRHPGVSREDATRNIVQAQLDQMQLDKLTRERAVAEGLAEDQAGADKATALTGPQIAASAQLVTSVVNGDLPAESAISLLASTLSITTEAAKAIIDPAVKLAADKAKNPKPPPVSPGTPIAPTPGAQPPVDPAVPPTVEIPS